ncbi:hypothetical protein AGDE_10412 [Angomonas deanei]|uniref:Uncharacterized protein n=1 Tax=Angomonas deanei TaxID=59799 RepID=A0A7G2CW26_9TRYP|nr:hypothetical protein AGDE_10412 [Angomonas deanei]CAD2222633.1 hypothetical protein, conserved [Angomonas deanei]|eukprot:EPY28377.1 hypothetical protein AGDE_10412 [Angomonas deanei]
MIIIILSLHTSFFQFLLFFFKKKKTITMSGHYHAGDPGLTQNQGNVLGDRPCVRQSKLYREQVGGNAMKDIMGQSELKWNTTQLQGAYGGGSVYDHNTADNRAYKSDSTEANIHQNGFVRQPEHNNNYNQYNNNNRNQNNNNNDMYQSSSSAYGNPQNNNNNRQSPGAPVPSGENASISTGKAARPGAGYANRQTYNIFTGQ